MFIGLPYLIALFMATVIGVIFNYFSFGRMVFKASGGLFALGKFIVAYVVIYAINALLLGILTEGNYLNPYFAQGLCIFLGVAI